MHCNIIQSMPSFGWYKLLVRDFIFLQTELCQYICFRDFYSPGVLGLHCLILRDRGSVLESLCGKTIVFYISREEYKASPFYHFLGGASLRRIFPKRQTRPKEAHGQITLPSPEITKLSSWELLVSTASQASAV